MKIKMLETQKARLSTGEVVMFCKGEEYEISDAEIASIFLREKYAESVNKEVEHEKTESLDKEIGNVSGKKSKGAR